MYTPIRIDENNKSTLPPLEVPVWLIEKDSVFIGCRTIVEDDEEDDRLTWLWGVCTGYWYDGKEQKWIAEDIELEDLYPVFWMELPNLKDLAF